MIVARRTMMEPVREIIKMVFCIVTNGIGVETKVTVGARWSVPEDQIKERNVSGNVLLHAVQILTNYIRGGSLVEEIVARNHMQTFHIATIMTLWPLQKVSRVYAAPTVLALTALTAPTHVRVRGRAALRAYMINAFKK